MKVPMVVDKGRLGASVEVEVGGGGTVYTGCSHALVLKHILCTTSENFAGTVNKLGKPQLTKTNELLQ